MQIFVNSIVGAYALQVEPSDSIDNVKQQLQAEGGLPVDQFDLMYAGVELDETLTLVQHNIQKESTLHLILHLRGGAKKRKKKTFTKPKKAKHHHKSVKLSILKCYQVDDDGKVTRTKKDCPSCGAGVRMAEHTTGKNQRSSCGRCGSTVLKTK